MHILFWLPNVIGYVRFLLVLVAYVYHFYANNRVFLFVISVSFLLDGLDGYAARKLNQQTSLGTVLDVVVDLFSRSLVWTLVHPMVGSLIVWWEWVTFISTHSLLGNNWKNTNDAPAIVTAVMRNNFKTVTGFYAVGSLFLLPMSLYIKQSMNIPIINTYINIIILFFITGRTLAFIVEAWYVGQYIQFLLDKDKQVKTTQKKE